jgi:N-acetylglutamate synthase-like GNAT family acetyltransferase
MKGAIAVKADVSDWPEIQTLLQKLCLDQKELDVNQFYVIKVNGKIVAAGRLVFHDKQNVEICSIGVYRTEREQGFGKSIVDTLISHAEKRTIWLVTEIPKYFEKLGFDSASVYPQSIADKKSRCLNELNCYSPQAMKYSKL